MEPLYLEAKRNGLLEEKIEELEKKASPCTLCPRRCHARRKEKKLGYCLAPYELYISSAFAHFGEERPLVGFYGSGTIFLTHCNLKCVFCQNYEISFFADGTSVQVSELADMMVALQKRGCHNINFVTPTHYVHQILKGLAIAIEKGLRIPIVYNCGGYESIEVIRLLDGVIDIYMPDIKFLDPKLTKKYMNAEDYPEVVMEVVKEMQRQVGDLKVDERGIAQRGLLIRHLVMPSHIEDTKKVLKFIKDEISDNAFVNIMAQYHPCHKASEFPEIARRLTVMEFEEALNYAKKIGLKRASTH